MADHTIIEPYSLRGNTHVTACVGQWAILSTYFFSGPAMTVLGMVVLTDYDCGGDCSSDMGVAEDGGGGGDDDVHF